MASMENQSIPAPALLEPRIMMDANLDWDLGSTTALSSSLSGLVQAFTEEIQGIEGFEPNGMPFGSFGDSPFGHGGRPGGASASLDPVLDAANRVTEAFSDLRSAIWDSGYREDDPGRDDDWSSVFGATGPGAGLSVCGPQDGFVDPADIFAICGPESGDAGPDISICGPESGDAGPGLSICGPEDGFVDPADFFAICGPEAGDAGPDISICGPDAGDAGPGLSVCGPEDGFVDPGNSLAICGPETGDAGPGLSVCGPEAGFVDPADVFAICGPEAQPVGAGQAVDVEPENHQPRTLADNPVDLRDGGYRDFDPGRDDDLEAVLRLAAPGQQISVCGPEDGFADVGGDWAICGPDDGLESQQAASLISPLVSPVLAFAGPALAPAQNKADSGSGVAPPPMPAGELPALLAAAERSFSVERPAAVGGAGQDDVFREPQRPGLMPPGMNVDTAICGPENGADAEVWPGSILEICGGGDFEAEGVAEPRTGFAICGPEEASTGPDTELAICAPETGQPTQEAGIGFSVCGPENSVSDLLFGGTPDMDICRPGTGNNGEFFVPENGMDIGLPDEGRDSEFANPGAEFAICGPESAIAPWPELFSVCEPEGPIRSGLAGERFDPSNYNWNFVDGVLPAWMDESLRHTFAYVTGRMAGPDSDAATGGSAGFEAWSPPGLPHANHGLAGSGGWHSLVDGQTGNEAETTPGAGQSTGPVGTSNIINGSSDFNVLRLVNDPSGLLGGIYDIFLELDSFFDDFLADINLPIVGDALGTGLTFFDDVMNSVILPALEYAETPLEDGSLPTTIQLLNGFVNDALNDVFGTEGETFLEVFLDTSGPTSESFIYGAVNFSGKLFSEMLDIDFDFGIPGLNIEVEEGSEILLELNYTINIGFGFDIDGFFLLNDTDEAEIGIEFLVDAGTFSGTMSVLNLLGLSAKAVTLDEDGTIISDATTDGGTARLTAFLEADLYGETGDEIERDFSNISPLDGEGNVLAYERIIYLSALDYSELVTFDFGAEIDVNIGVVGNVLDPFSGDALTIGGNEILPNVAAELVLKGSFTVVDGLTVDALGIQNVRVDASQLYDALIRPIVDPIMAIVGPLLEVIDVIFQDPIGLVKDLAVDLIAVWFPIIKLGDNVAEIANSIAQFVVDLADAGGMVHFGSFDFTGHADGLVSGETSATDIDLSTLDRTGFITDDGSGGFGTFGDAGDGFSVDIPLIQDPFAALSLLLGDFSGVDLARARYTWFNIDADALDISEQLIDSLDVSDAVKDALRLLESGVGIRNEIDGTGVTQFEVGYDMSGIENFLNSYDPFRLFDGVFIEASAGSLVDIDMTINMFASALIASIGGGGVVDIEFNITDPNDDGKVRISELLDAILYMVEQGAVTPHQQIAYLLEGHIDFDLFVEATFLGIPTTLYELNIPPLELELYNPEPSLVGSLDSNRFGILSLQGLLDLLGAGGGSGEAGTQVLNLGARIAAANTDMITDGNDYVVLGSLLNRYLVSLTNSEGDLEGEIDSNANAVIIPAGEGDNVIDMTHFGEPESDLVTITYSGAGQDTITLPMGGVNVVFAGNGDDIITAPPGAQGTYIIFAEGGADTIDIPGGNVIVFSGDDYGMRDVFLTQFAQGNVTAEAVRALLGLNADDTIDAGADGFYNTGGADLVNLATLVENYTEISQLKADRDVETVTVGSGNHVILTGKGDDVIRGALDGTGEVTVLSGAGDDDIAIGGTTVVIEGGAGSDTIQVNGENVEVWGWGKAAGEAGGLGTASEIDALAQNDGNDIIIGGSGNDQLFGQGGDDLIEGNGGNDTIGGGMGNDVLSGGTFEFTVDGTARDIRDVDLRANLTGEMDIRIRDLADGNDTMRGGQGDDILLGGGGADIMNGDGGLDLMAGDFASIIVTGNMVARHMSSLFTDSSRQGADTMDGGAMNDILLGGGDGDQLTAATGNNVLMGDFGAIDGADIRDAITLIASINDASGGNDTLTTGRGNDRLVGGEGDDTLNSGLGVDVLFGDNARMDYAARTFTGQGLDTDGDDTLILGENLGGALPAPTDLDDLVFGGLGDDMITASVGGLTLIGDSGEMRLRADALAALAAYEDPGQSPTAQVLAQAEAAWFQFNILVEEARTFADVRDGNDHVIVAGGTNAMALGGGDDRAELLDGLNHLLADDGILRTMEASDGASVLHEMISTAMAAASGRDQITAGDGNNVVIGGDQGDLFEMGDGFNLIIGDRGAFLTSDSQTNGHLRSDGSLVGGDDRITTGAGNAIIIGGQGDDMVSVGDGDDVATGDDADITHSNGWDILDLTTLHQSSGGDDILTAANTRGDNVLLGQTGNDRLDGGLDDDLLAGDNGNLVFLAPEMAFAAQSGLDRFIRFESVTPGVDGDDLIYGHDGTDYLIGGFGEEDLYGGNGQDFLIGDTAIMTRAYSAAGGGVSGELWIDTNFAFETGGYDRLFGEAGFDVMIGNLGPDLFYGNTEEDALFSDGFAGYFTTQWDSNLFAQPTPHWQLVQVNFAGPGAIDIVSKAQSASSIGLSLDRLPEDNESGAADMVPPYAANDIHGRDLPPGAMSGHLDAVMDYVLSDLLMSTIAELMAMGLDGEALRDAIAAELAAFMSQSLQIDGATQALMLERVMTIIEDRLGLGPAQTEPQILVAAE